MSDLEGLFDGQEKANHVRFYPKQIMCNDGTMLKRDYILIVSPGQNRSEFRGPVQEHHKRLYAVQWKAYQDGVDAPSDGRPLTDLKVLSDERIRSLENINIRTVEQLAAVADGNLTNVGMGALALRQLAQDYLRTNSGDVSDMNSQIQELMKKIDMQSKEIERLKGGRNKAA